MYVRCMCVHNLHTNSISLCVCKMYVCICPYARTHKHHTCIHPPTHSHTYIIPTHINKYITYDSSHISVQRARLSRNRANTQHVQFRTFHIRSTQPSYGRTCTRQVSIFCSTRQQWCCFLVSTRLPLSLRVHMRIFLACMRVKCMARMHIYIPFSSNRKSALRSGGATLNSSVRICV
jgi:hypothetical protein